MRLLRYSNAAGTGYGLISADDTGVIDLTRRIQGANDLDELIAQGRLNETQAFANDKPDFDACEISYERLLRWPSKIFCIGVNYRGRSGEYADTSSARYPSVFVRFPDSLTGHDQPLIRPCESTQLDYEGEITVIIGTGGRRIPVEAARSHIAGVSLGNEGTVRDWTRHAKFNVTQGKNWPCSGSLGPWLIPVEEVGDFADLCLTTTVNGEVRQHDTVAAMAYPIDYQIHYLSTFTELRPGDVIFTGTPTGAGARFDPPVWLKPGDVVEVTVPGIGTLRNPIETEIHDN